MQEFLSKAKSYHIQCILEPVCCKKQQKKSSWPVTGLQNRGPLKDLNDSKLIVQGQCPWSSRINFIPFRIFRGPLFHKPVTGQGIFFAVSYSKPALEVCLLLVCLAKKISIGNRIDSQNNLYFIQLLNSGFALKLKWKWADKYRII